MQYTVTKCDKKSSDWYILNLKDISGNPVEQVSVNKINKKNEAFPNFDLITEGYTLQGELWTSTQGKNYLFAPKQASTGNSGASRANKTAEMNKVIEKKAVLIEKAQDNKELGIKTSSTIRMAVDCAVAENDVSHINILKWREWFWNNWEVPADIEPPFK